MSDKDKRQAFVREAFTYLSPHRINGARRIDDKKSILCFHKIHIGLNRAQRDRVDLHRSLTFIRRRVFRNLRGVR